MRFTRLRRVPLTAAAGLTVALLAAACSSAGGSTSSPSKLEKTNVTVAVVSSEGASGLFLAQEKGFFAKQGLHVTIKKVTNDLTIIPNLLHGSIDVAGGEWGAIIAAQAHGVGKFHALANGSSLAPHVNDILALPSSHITSPAQLRGKTIGVPDVNAFATEQVSAVLADYGIKPSQVHFVVVPFPDMPTALAAHRVDAVSATEPFVTETETKTGAQVVADIDTGSLQNIPVNGYMVTEQWYHRYPHTAAAFARAIGQGNSLASTNIAALQHVLVTALHIPAKVADTMAVSNFDTTKVDPVQLQRVADLMLRFGQLKHKFNVKVLTQ